MYTKCLSSETKEVFKKWKNKKYSVFQSLKKNIKIGFLPLVYVLLCSNTVLSQTDTIKLEEIIVNSTRIPSLYTEISRNVVVIQNDEIKNSSVKDLADVLKLALGVDVRQRGAYGTQTDISVRGGSFEQTLILINGIKFNDPQTGHHNFNLPINVDDIERIEILQGAGARIYGQNAFTGAINIITNENYENKIGISTNIGQYGLLSGSLSSSFTYKKISNYISVTKKKCAGYITNTDFDVLNFFYQGNLNTKFAKYSIQTGINDKSFGANSFYTPKYPNQYEITNTFFIAVKSEFGKQIKFNPSIFWRKNTDIFQLFRETENWYHFQNNYFIRNENDTAKYYPGIYEKWNYYTEHNFHLTNTFGGEINSNFRTKIGKTAFGFEYRSEEIFSNKLGEKIDSTVVPFLDDKYFTFAHKRENLSAFIDQSKSFKKMYFAAGVLINYSSDFGRNFYSGLDFSYFLSQNLKLISSVNQSMRMPTFTDLFYQGPANIGNPNLIPEKAITYEVGFKFFNKKITSNITIFRRNCENLIDWVKLNENDKWESKNITNLTTYGLDFHTSINLNSIFDKIIFNYSYLITDKKENDYISNYALDYLIHNASVNVVYKTYKHFGFSWSADFQMRNGTFSKYDYNSQTTTEEKYKPVLLLNCKLFWKNDLLEIYSSASNILNQKYYDIGNIEMPGLWISGGVKINLLL